MSKNIDQVFNANPITTNIGTDLMYFGQSPYTTGDDAAMEFSDFSAQFGSPTQIQQSAFNVGVDSGTANNYVVTVSPVISSYTDGLAISFTALHSNTITNPVINISGLGNKTIKRPGNLAVVAGDILSSSITYLIYSVAANACILINPIRSGGGGGGVTSDQVQQAVFNTASDTGTTDAYVVPISPSITTGFSYPDGLIVYFFPNNTSTITMPTLDAGTFSRP